MNVELIRYLIDNMKSFTPGEWILVAIATVVIGGGLFLLFRSLYRARYQAQSELIAIKEQTISDYKERSAAVNSQRQQLQDQVETYESALNALSQHAAEVKSERDVLEALLRRIVPNLELLRLAVVRLEFLRGSLNYARLLYGLMVIYYEVKIESHVQGAPPVAELYRRL